MKAKPPDSTTSSSLAFSPSFKLAFFTVLGLTILSLLVSVLLVLQDRQSTEAKQLIDSCSTTWKMGFGAIVGLIGGKAT